MGDDERDIVEDEARPAEPEGSSSTSKIVKILLYAAGAIIVVVLMIGISYLVSKNVQERCVFVNFLCVTIYYE